MMISHTAGRPIPAATPAPRRRATAPLALDAPGARAGVAALGNAPMSTDVALRRRFVRGVLVGGLAVVVVVLAARWVPVPGAAGCEAPTFIRSYAGPEATVADLIERHGGLPQDATDFSSLSAPVHAVAGYTVRNVAVRNNQGSWFALLDDDPAYRLAADIAVEYEDGSRHTFRWSTWRYGLALCPLVIGMGDGPPGSWVELE